MFFSFLGNECSKSPYIFLCHCLLLFVGEKPNALAEPRGEEESLTKKGKKKKTVHWAEEEQLKHYFYFDLDETERGKACGSEYPASPSSVRTVLRHLWVCQSSEKI